jgi:WD40 repeat protein
MSLFIYLMSLMVKNREAPIGVWTLVHAHRLHESSVNSISWAPHELGLILACASSDGRVSILQVDIYTYIQTLIQLVTYVCTTLHSTVPNARLRDSRVQSSEKIVCIVCWY